jgi:YegS/Rv2252/BmrU family lipid kinase
MQSPSALSCLRAAHAVVFVNPQAGGGRARKYLTPIQALFRSLEVPAEWITPDSAGELESVVRAAISQGHKALFAIGGDGTFQGLVNAAYGADVLLGILPLGGGNDFATAAGIPIHPVKATEALMHGTIRCVDLVRACTADGRTRLYAGGGGVGLDAEALCYASREYRRLPGRLRYIASALHALVGYTPLEIRLEFPGNEEDAYSGEVLLAGVLNTPTYGGGLRLAPGATLDDGLLHVVLIEDLKAFEILKLLPRLTASGELRTERVKRWRVQRVRLSTGRPCLFHGDGEILGPTPVELELARDAVRLLVPFSMGGSGRAEE